MATSSKPSSYISKKDIKKLQSKLEDSFSDIELESDINIIHKLDNIPWITGTITQNALNKLQSNPNVAMIVKSKPLELFLAQSGPLVNRDQAHNLGYTGYGVTVAVIDSGIDTDHPNLNDNLIWEECFLYGGGCPKTGGVRASGHGSAEDNNGHGTHVSGIITSSDSSNKGVAPEADIIAIKILDSERHGTFGDAVAAIDWITSNKDVYGIRVINMSFGGGKYSGICDTPDPAMAATADAAKNAGITLFAASGNNAYTSYMGSPACLSSVISVGSVYDNNVGSKSWCLNTNCTLTCTDSTTQADKIVCFTNVSSVLDILAPGALITSTWMGGGMKEISGTSMASPHAVAVAALMLQKNVLLTPDDIRNTLKNTGKSILDTKVSKSFQRVDAVDALNSIATKSCADADSYEPNDSQAQAYGPLSSDSSYNGWLCTGSDIDWYKVDAANGDLVHFTLDVPYSNDFDLELYDALGQLVASSTNGAGLAESISYRLSSPGTYYVKVYSKSYQDSKRPSYVLTYTLNDSASVPFKEDFESGVLGSHWQTRGYGNDRILITKNHSPYSGSYHLTMDSSLSEAYSLNELILTIDLSGHSGVILSFYHKEFGDEDDIMPNSFSGSHWSDGVAVSADGNTWYKVQGLTSADSISFLYKQFTVDLDSAIAAHGISYNSAFKIKFQQYDNYEIPSKGFAFDDIEINANTPPSTSKLVYPANGQTGLGTTVEFRWKKSSDPDGDTVTYYLYYSIDPNFIGVTPIHVASLNKTGIYYADIWSGLLLFGILFGYGVRVRRKIALLFITMIMITIMLIASCGGGGGGSGGGNSSTSTPNPSDEITEVVSGLSAGTTYYWKVAADDGKGGIATSDTFSFKTQ